MQGFIGIFEILGYGNLLENNSEADSAQTADKILGLIAQAREETRGSIQFGDEDGDGSAEELEGRTRWLVFSDRVVFTIRLEEPVAAPAATVPETPSSTPPESTFVDPEAFILSSSATDTASSGAASVQTKAPPAPPADAMLPEGYERNVDLAKDTGEQAAPDDPTLAAMCLMSAVTSASFFQFIMFQAGLPLRGALHFGNFHYEHDAGASAGLAGEGVDEVSSLCDRLDFSGIVISPPAWERARYCCEETEGLAEILEKELVPALIPMRWPAPEEKLATVDWLRGARETEEYANLDLIQYTYERFWDHGKDIGSEMETVLQNTIKMLRYFQMLAARENAREETLSDSPTGWSPSPPGIDLG